MHKLEIVLWENAKWSEYCLPIALFSAVIILSCASQIGLVMTLVWLQFVVYLLHQSEEHFWPGGFKEFIKRSLGRIGIKNQGLTEKEIFWINIPIIWGLFPLFAVLAQNVNILFGLFLPFFGIFNALTHVGAALIEQRYNPGLVISLFVQIPSSVFTLYVMHQRGYMPLAAALCIFGVVILIHAGLILYVISKN